MTRLNEVLHELCDKQDPLEVGSEAQNLIGKTIKLIIEETGMWGELVTITGVGMYYHDNIQHLLNPDFKREGNVLVVSVNLNHVLKGHLILLFLTEDFRKFFALVRTWEGEFEAYDAHANLV